MKRSVSIILTLLMLFTFIMPANALEGYDKELESVIIKAKTLFDISDDFDEFNYYITDRLSETEYHLSWFDSSDSLGEIDVTINSEGRVKSYYRYNYNRDSENNGFPEISKEEGLKKVNEFLKKIAPELVGKIKYVEKNEPLNINSRTYSYSFYRVENDVPFYDNNLYVNVNNRTGEIQSYNCYWENNLKFDSKEGIMDLANAKKAYNDKLGLQLVYKLDYSDGEYQPYLVYTSLFSGKVIDAKTGEPVDYNFSIMNTDEVALSKEAAFDSGESAVNLTPKELEAISEAKEIISKEEAENTARAILDIDDEYSLKSINLYSNWYDKDEYNWSMYFENSENKNISVTLDAKNRELKSFYKYGYYREEQEVKYDREQLQQKAEEFIKKVQKDKFNLVELVSINEPIIRPLLEEQPRQQYFTFMRKVDEAYFQGNGFNINIDAATGEITSYNYNWYKGELPSQDKAISFDKAYKILYDDIGMELQYMRDTSEPYADLDVEQNVRLVYAIKNDKPLNIDAITGEIIYGLNRPYKENTIDKYSDIEDSEAKEEIETLALFGISLPGDKFKPQIDIKQKEFLYLLLKAKNYYYNMSPEDDDFIERLYDILIGQGIVKESEKSPEEKITREEVTKYFVRILGYEKIAEIKDIYKLDFKDADSISEELIGYVAIATGLGVVDGDGENFNPKTNLTREQAAVLIYNFLDRR